MFNYFEISRTYVVLTSPAGEGLIERALVRTIYKNKATKVRPIDIAREDKEPPKGDIF